ncbi:MAG: hypothetical protein AAB639_03330 [Patescibacteria group bacterium]
MRLSHKQLTVHNDWQGQSLVEVVIALGVVVVLAVSLVSASLVTQRSARSAKNNTQATKLVQQTIENLRIFRDRQGFAALANNSCWVLVNTSDTNVGNWKLANNLTNPSADCPQSISLAEVTFTRSIAIENGANSNQKKVTVVVTWVESGGTQTVTNVTNLSNCITTSVAC